MRQTRLWKLAAIVKHAGKGVNNTNVDRFMPSDTALPLFRAFIEMCKGGINRKSLTGDVKHGKILS